MPPPILGRLSLADTSRGFSYRACYYIAFSCILFGVEEYLRSFAHLGRTAPRNLSLTAIGIGVVRLFLGDKAPKAWQRVRRWSKRKPPTPTTTAKSPPALAFDGFRPWRSPYSFQVPLGTQNLTVVYVRNNQLASAEPIYNVRARIEYSWDKRPAFSIDAAVWWEEHREYGLRKLTRVDLEANESQCFAVFMEKPPASDQPQTMPKSALFSESDGFGARDLIAGRWTARITVTADHKEPLCGEVEFTVYPRENDRKLVIGQQGDLGAVRLPVEC